MDSRTRNVFVGLFVLVVGVAVSAAILLGQAPAGPPAGTQSVEGVIVSVDSAGLTDVMGFDLLTSDGETVTFSLQFLENGATFPPGHLVEHQASASPVRVWYRSVGAVFFAIALEDAVPPG